MLYIDFDNTIYETGRLTKDVLSTLAQTIGEETNSNPVTILEDIMASFNSTVDNFYSLSNNLSKKYFVSSELLHKKINEIILFKGKDYVFPDAIEFLNKLRANREPSCILTYVAQTKNISQQNFKLIGSGIYNYVDEVYCTTRYKYKLDIDYEHSTFIDDSPRDLEGLYFRGAKKIIRIKKPSNTKRTSVKLNLPIDIPTYTSFDDIPLFQKDKPHDENQLAF
jgi:hypothetical protein